MNKEETIIACLGAITSLKYFSWEKGWKHMLFHLTTSVATTYACTDGVCSFLNIVNAGQVGLIGFLIGTFATAFLDKLYNELKEVSFLGIFKK